jgi:hypothetical protein
VAGVVDGEPVLAATDPFGESMLAELAVVAEVEDFRPPGQDGGIGHQATVTAPVQGLRAHDRRAAVGRLLEDAVEG